MIVQEVEEPQRRGVDERERRREWHGQMPDTVFWVLHRTCRMIGSLEQTPSQTSSARQAVDPRHRVLEVLVGNLTEAEEFIEIREPDYLQFHPLTREASQLQLRAGDEARQAETSDRRPKTVRLRLW